MRTTISVFQLLLIGIFLSSCNKEEPFQYPEKTKKLPAQLNVYAERKIISGEGWVNIIQTEGCNPNIAIENLAFTELVYDHGFATIHLVPDSISCELDAALHTDFKPAEVTDWTWDSLTFEFTYSEYQAGVGTECWLTLNYNNLNYRVNLAPAIGQLISKDTTDGVFKLNIKNNEPYCTINGKTMDVNYNEGNGNTFALDAAGDQNSFQISMHSEGQSTQSFIQFRFLRISRFGIPDA